MSLFLYILGGLALFALAMIVTRKPRRRRREVRAKAKQSRKIGKEADRLLALAEQGDDDAQRDLVKRQFRSTDPARKRRLAANARAFKARKKADFVRRDWEQYGKPALTAHAAWQLNQDEGKAVLLLAKFVSAYRQVTRDQNLRRIVEQTGLRRKEARRLLKATVEERYEALVSAISHDSNAFFELRDLILESRSFYSAFARAGIGQLTYPDRQRWNDCVARYFTQPTVNEFLGVKWRYNGELRHWAADALREEDFTRARIVLAFCDSGPQRKAAYEELGDVLIADLAKFVSAHLAELGLVETPTSAD